MSFGSSPEPRVIRATRRVPSVWSPRRRRRCSGPMLSSVRSRGPEAHSDDRPTSKPAAAPYLFLRLLDAFQFKRRYSRTESTVRPSPAWVGLSSRVAFAPPPPANLARRTLPRNEVFQPYKPLCPGFRWQPSGVRLGEMIAFCGESAVQWRKKKDISCSLRQGRLNRGLLLWCC